MVKDATFTVPIVKHEQMPVMLNRKDPACLVDLIISILCGWVCNDSHTDEEDHNQTTNGERNSERIAEEGFQCFHGRDLSTLQVKIECGTNMRGHCGF